MKSTARGWVYFIGAEGSDLTKIGFSTRPRARLSQVQSGNPERLRILYAFPADKGVEARLHDILAPSRRVGEWFAGSAFIRLVGEQILALHLARIMKRMGLDLWPDNREMEAELYVRARANRVANSDVEKAVDLALDAFGA